MMGWLCYVWCTSPWLLTRPAVNFTLDCSDKSNTPPEIFRHRFYELCHEFKNYCRIFTDGCKEGNRVCSITWYSKHLQSWIICHSACDRCGPALKEKNFVIFSDSMSSLQSINGFNLDSDLVQKFLKNYTVLAKKWQKHYSLLDSKSCGNSR